MLIQRRRRKLRSGVVCNWNAASRNVCAKKQRSENLKARPAVHQPTRETWDEFLLVSMNMIRKGQLQGVEKGGIQGQITFMLQSRSRAWAASDEARLAFTAPVTLVTIPQSGLGRF